MIDIKLLREDPDRVRASQRARGDDEGVVDAIRAADERRRASLTAYERVRAEQKSVGKEVARASGEEKQALLARTKDLAAQVRSLQAAADEAQAELDASGEFDCVVVNDDVARAADELVSLLTAPSPGLVPGE